MSQSSEHQTRSIELLPRDNCKCDNDFTCTGTIDNEREVSRFRGNNYDIVTIERDVICSGCDVVIATHRETRAEACANTDHQDDLELNPSDVTRRLYL